MSDAINKIFKIHFLKAKYYLKINHHLMHETQINTIHSHILITPSQPLVNTVEGFVGCQAHAIVGPLL